MPSITRRRLLASGAAVGGAAGGGALLPASYLPDTVALWRTRLRSVPEVSARPPVTDGHATAAREDLGALIDRAERAWGRVEDPSVATENLPGLVDPDRSIRSARSHLEDARSESGWDALFSVRRGAGFAGEAIGGARLALGEASGDRLAARAREIQAALGDERDRIAYEVRDPSAGLARLYWVEKWLHLGGLNSYRNGVYAGQDEPTTRYDDRAVVRTWGSHAEARRYRADAAALYDDYRDGADGPWRDLTEHVEGADEQLLAEAREATFTHEEFEDRLAAVESLPEGPSRTFRWFVTYYVQNADVRSPRGPAAGLSLYRAVENAETVLKARALADVTEDRLDGADRVPGSLLDETQREALSLFRRHLEAAADRPLLALLLREGRRLLWAGGTEFEKRGAVDHPRARAYAKYRLALGYLRNVEAVAARLDRPSSD